VRAGYRRKILVIGTATAEAYEKQVDAVGQLDLAGIEATKAIAAAGLKITPDVMVGGGGAGESSGVFSAFIAQLLTANRSSTDQSQNGSGALRP
jgi:hypothetical protein